MTAKEIRDRIKVLKMQLTLIQLFPEYFKNKLWENEKITVEERVNQILDEINELRKKLQ